MLNVGAEMDAIVGLRFYSETYVSKTVSKERDSADLVAVVWHLPYQRQLANCVAVITHRGNQLRGGCVTVDTGN